VTAPALLIARREIRARVGDRMFRVSMVVSLLVIVGIAVVPKLLAGSPSAWEIGAVGDVNLDAARIAAAQAPDDRPPTVAAYPSDLAARAAVDDGAVDVAILADGSLLADESIPADLEAAVRQGQAQATLTSELEARGLPADEVLELLGPAPVELLDPPDEAHDRRVGFAAIGVILLFMQLIGFCVWVANGIVEEKASRIIEILLAKVRPRQLMAGKVAGIGVLGLTQLVAFLVVGLLAFTLADRFPIPSGVWPLVGVLAVAFAVGYLLYAGLFTIAGALAARSEDLQATSMPFTLVMTASYIGAMGALADPSGGLARALTLVPFSAPLVVPVRVAAGSIAAWEVAASIALCALATAALVLIAERVFRGGVMRTQKVRLREALRATRSDGRGTSRSMVGP
jgi:ABC-2 type transport system permease protein